MVQLSLLSVAPAFAQTATPTATGQTAPVFDLTESTSAYRLGPGDVIEVVNTQPEERLSRIILTDGTISLPLIGAVRLTGLSQEQAGQQITELYRPYLKSPQVSVAVINPRPLNVTVLGEVSRPGPYTIGNPTNNAQIVGPTVGSSANNSSGQGSVGGIGGGRLTVTQALATAGGVTESADVQHIELIRVLPGGKKSVARIDLWAMITRADTLQDQPLVDGDAILVPKTIPGKSDVDNQVVNVSTLAPSTVEVRVVGEVNRPGIVAIKPGSRFTDAIVAAGGINDNGDPRDVELHRLNPDGSVKSYALAAILEQGYDEQKNPALQKGDIIRVKRSFGASLKTFISDISSPVFLLNIFRNIIRTFP